jgi:hypothetical protein
MVQAVSYCLVIAIKFSVLTIGFSREEEIQVGGPIFPSSCVPPTTREGVLEVSR